MLPQNYVFPQLDYNRTGFSQPFDLHSLAIPTFDFKKRDCFAYPRSSNMKEELSKLIRFTELFYLFCLKCHVALESKRGRFKRKNLQFYQRLAKAWLVRIRNRA